MTAFIRIAFALAVLLLASPDIGHALVLYDAFNGITIDPAKWSGFEAESGGDAETGRRVTLGSLRLNYTAFGNDTSDSGRPGGAQGLSVRNPDDVTAMQATVTVLEATAQGCPANAASSRARLQILGDFFNDGSGDAGNGDRTGNIRVGIQKVLDSTQGRIIEAFVNRCQNAACTTQLTLVGHVFTTTWAPLVAHVLKVEWEPWNSQFVFTVNPGRRQEQVALPYDIEEIAPAVFPFKNVAVSNSMPNCLAGRKKAAADGLFNDVMTNPAP